VFSSCYFVPIMNHFFLFFGWCAARLSTVSLTESGCPVGVEDLQDVRGGTRCVSTPDSACGWPLCEAVMVPCSGCSSACVLGAGRHPVPLTADAAAHRLTPPMPGRSPLSPFGFRARCQQPGHPSVYTGEADEMSYRGQPNGVDGKGPRGVEDSAERGDPVPPHPSPNHSLLGSASQVALVLSG